MTPPPAAAAPLAPAGRARSARAQGAVGHRLPLSAPRPARRVSGPARGRRAGPARAGANGGGAPAHRALAALGRLAPGGLARRATSADSLRSLQRRLSGRLGIALVAFALIGIVTLQLGLLKLNGGIGRALAHEAALQRENAALSIENSELTAGDRVELRAAGIGMQYVAPSALKPLVAQPARDAARAAAALRAPALTAAPLAATSAGPAGESPAGSGETGGSQASTASARGEAQSSPAAEGQPSEQTAAGSERAPSNGTQSAAGAPGAEATAGGEGAQPSANGPSTPASSEAASAGGTATGARAAG
jgi:hypothetical protein